MTTVSLPLPDHDFKPNLPYLDKGEHHWMGRLVHSIHASKEKGFIRRVIVYALALLASFALVFSFVGIPIFIYGYKEYIQQGERIFYEKKYQNLLEVSTEHAKQQFLRGRISPLDMSNINLRSSTRSKMIKDLDIEEKNAIHKKDIDLLRMVAAKYSDFLTRYNLRING